MQGRFSKIKSIEEDGTEDVYCLASKKNRSMIANGFVVANCDALRYALASCFPTGELNHPDEQLTIDQLRRQVYGDEPMIFNPSVGGYF